MTEELLTIDDIAALYRVSRRQARDVITKLVGFPSRVPGSSERRPLWLRDDILAFMRRA
jgi:hypothetical protein